MATTNNINLTGSGIVSYDGAGVFSSAGLPLAVAHGGTGNSSFIIRSMVFGGTTSTNPLQTVNGSTTDTILTSNGANALPSLVTHTRTQNLIAFAQTTPGNPLSNKNYELSVGLPVDHRIAGASPADLSGRFSTVTSAFIRDIYGTAFVNGTLGSSESCSISLGGTSSVSFNLSSAVNNFSITGLSGTAVINFSRIHFITPTWVTVPTNVSISCTFVFGI